MRAPSSGHCSRICIGADDGDVVHLAQIQRQQVSCVLQQNEALEGALPGNCFSGLVVARNRGIRPVGVQPPKPIRNAENASDFVVDDPFTDRSVADRGLQSLDAHEPSHRHLKVETGIGRADPVVRRGPVRHVNATEAPLSLQDISDKRRVGGRALTIHQVVGAHHGTDMCLLYCGFEDREIYLAQRSLIYCRIRGVPRVLRLVADEMLDSRTHVLRLHSFDVADR